MRLTIALGLVVLLAISGCKTAYYNTWEKMGWHKRDILVDNVAEARDSQEEAKEEFQTAMERFVAVTNFQGGDLADKYDELNGSYESSKAQADEVRAKIKDVETVAEDLFEEWESEIEQYQSTDLKRNSERQLRDTRKRYTQMVGAMNDAAAKMEPVLAALHDQVLYLKHNLNARAIASLQDTAADLQTDVERLIREMQESIDEANRFIDQMGAGEPS